MSKQHDLSYCDNGRLRPNALVRNHLGPYQDQVQGRMYGLEIEVESTNDRYPGRVVFNTENPFWTSVQDGSLRNSSETEQGGREFIFKKPLPYESVEPALVNLTEALRASRTAIRRSNRTSVHVHVNVQHLTLRQLVTFLALYYAVEPILSRFNGFQRANNLFCVQALQAPSIIEEVEELLRSRRIPADRKYSALNLLPLREGGFGTVEFRAGEGIEDSPLEMLEWVNLIESLFIAAESFNNPYEVVEGMSMYGPLRFLEDSCPSIYEAGKSLFRLHEYESVVMEAATSSQSLIYNINWS